MGEGDRLQCFEAMATKSEILLMHRPQQLSLSLIPRVEARSFGQVTPARPRASTSASLIPLQIQTYMMFSRIRF